MLVIAAVAGLWGLLWAPSVLDGRYLIISIFKTRQLAN